MITMPRGVLLHRNLSERVQDVLKPENRLKCSHTTSELVVESLMSYGAFAIDGYRKAVREDLAQELSLSMLPRLNFRETNTGGEVVTDVEMVVFSREEFRDYQERLIGLFVDVLTQVELQAR